MKICSTKTKNKWSLISRRSSSMKRTGEGSSFQTILAILCSSRALNYCNWLNANVSWILRLLFSRKSRQKPKQLSLRNVKTSMKTRRLKLRGKESTTKDRCWGSETWSTWMTSKSVALHRQYWTNNLSTKWLKRSVSETLKKRKASSGKFKESWHSVFRRTLICWTWFTLKAFTPET